MSMDENNNGMNNDSIQEDTSKSASKGLPKKADAEKNVGNESKKDDGKRFSFGSFRGFGKQQSAKDSEKNNVNEPSVGSSIETLTPKKKDNKKGLDDGKTPLADLKTDNKGAAPVPEGAGETPKKKYSFRELGKQNKLDSTKNSKKDDSAAAAAADTMEKKTQKKDGKKPGKRADRKADKKPKGLPKKSSNGLPKKSRKPLKKWQIVLIVIGILFVAGAGTVFALYQANRVDISSYTYTQKQKTQIISSDNVVIGELFSENRTYVSLNQVPDNMKNALISVEDSRFYSHGGVDFWGIARSMVANLIRGKATSQGASTLTQQLARLLFLPDISTEQTFTDSINRKFKEISIAWQLEKKYSKDQILEMYLNEYYFGSSAYGIEEASKTYFGKDIWDCNLAECAMLAGLPQAPSAYAPNYNFQAAKTRQEIVLDRMVKEGYITQQQCDEAKATEITVVPWSSDSLNDQITPGYEKFVNRALEQYAEAQAPTVMKQQGLSEDDAITSIRTQVASGGYKLYTTINTNMQTTMMNVSQGNYPEGSSITDAMVTVNNDGAVLAYYGGNTDIDMANTARQPGSNIKPLYYSGAIEQGLFTADSVVSDSTQSYGGYTPKNYDNTSMGNITITRALVMSRNVPSVYVMNTMGVDNAMSWMKNMGISTIVNDDYSLATATGGMTYGIKPIDMAGAFNCFNDGGVYHEPYFVTQVQKSNGDKVFDQSQLNLETRQVMSQNTATTMWNILRQVVTSGTATAANSGYVTAGKTGTTDNAEDLWFTGMTGTLTTSVWIGSVEHQVVGGSESTLSCNLYRAYMATLGNNGWIPGI